MIIVHAHYQMGTNLGYIYTRRVDTRSFGQNAKVRVSTLHYYTISITLPVVSSIAETCETKQNKQNICCVFMFMDIRIFSLASGGPETH